MQPRIPMIFTEVFPITTTDFPQLFAYTLDAPPDAATLIGRKLAYRFQRTFGGHWIWSNFRIITDVTVPLPELLKRIARLWQEEGETYRSLQSIAIDSQWQPTPRTIADFVAIGLIRDLHLIFQQVLTPLTVNLGPVIVERTHDIRGWVVQGQPALSVSVGSHILAKEDVSQFASRTNDPQSLIGLLIMDKGSGLKGEIVKYIGTVQDNRTRLLNLAQRKDSQDMIRRASDQEAVLRVQCGRGSYDFVASALRIIIRTEDYSRFHVNGTQVTKALRLAPPERSGIVSKIAKIAKNRHLIEQASYRSTSVPHLFLQQQTLHFTPALLIGGNTRITNLQSVFLQLRRTGIYRRAEAFPPGVSLRVGILNTLSGIALETFITRVQHELRSFHFDSTIAANVTISSDSRDELERGLTALEDAHVDIILALLSPEGEEEEGKWSTYHHFKSLTIGRGIPSQVIHPATLAKENAFDNIILGMLSKVGNIPYILADPLPYADIVVGIDIARRKKARLTGSLNATAIARIYLNTGEFLRYVIHDAPLEGETIPADILYSLFPVQIFQGKRVVIHRDGYFRGNEKQALQQWGEKLGAQFHLVEVIKSGTPRLYDLQANAAQQPPKGSALKVNDQEAFLVSSLPPFRSATPAPLHIRAEAPFPIEQALHSVLSMTLLHYGSVRAPRLPVTIHYSDKIAYLALKGIKPKHLEGSLPFWL